MKKITRRSIAAFLAGLITIVIFSQGAASQSEAPDSGAQDNKQSEAKDLIVIRTFDASVEEVWKYWAESEYVKKWWAPTGFTTPLARMDFREGGTSLVCMRAPGGQDFYSTWTYRKITPMKMIEYIHNLADKDGKKADPVKVGLPADFPQDVRNVITFKTVGDNKTEMIVTEYGYTSEQWFNLSKAGLEQCLDKMAAALGGAHGAKEERKK
jgi:uncharacterized protein YndB with AHSA1/START domain